MMTAVWRMDQRRKERKKGDCLGCYHVHPGQRWWFDYAGNSGDRIFACEIAFESESLKSDEKKKWVLRVNTL